MAKEERLVYGMTLEAMVMAMTNGNPGAISVVVSLLRETETFDPDNTMGGLGILTSLDTAGVYGHRIWGLFKDVCGEDIGKTVGIIRAKQLGIINQAVLDHAIDNYGEGLDLDTIFAAVQELVPNFRLTI